jgi:hypothetical protein
LRNPALAGLVGLLLAGSERILALPSLFLSSAALAWAILLRVLIAGPLALAAAAFNVLFLVCAVQRRRFSSGCKPHPATAPAGSNRSSRGGERIG